MGQTTMMRRSLHRIAFAALAWLAGCGGKSHTGDDGSRGGQSATTAGASAGGWSGASGEQGGQTSALAGHAGIVGTVGGGATGTSESGGSSGGSSNGGGNAGQAGNQVTGGTGNGGDADLGAVITAACSSVCGKFESTSGSSCENLGSLGRTCQTDCTSTFVAPVGACANQGLEMMACLTRTVPSADLDDCWIQFYDVVQKCYVEVDDYEACLAANDASLPETLCAKISSTHAADPETNGSAGCKEDRKCLNGSVFAVTCEQTLDGQSSCTCQRGGGNVTDFVWLGSAATACKEALAGCRAMAVP